MSIKLRIIENGEERFHEIRSHETIIRIGRQKDCDVVLDHEKKASRQHCQIEKKADGTYVLVDLESSNGTHVNGVQIRRKDLTLGDKIHVGDTVLYFGEPVPVKKVAPRQTAMAARPMSGVRAGGAEVAVTGSRRVQRKSQLVQNLLTTAIVFFVLGIAGLVVWRNLDSNSNAIISNNTTSELVVVDTTSKDAAISEIRRAIEGTLPLEKKMTKAEEVVNKYAGRAEYQAVKAEFDKFIAEIGVHAKRALGDLIERIKPLYEQESRYTEAVQALENFERLFNKEMFNPQEWSDTLSEAKRTVIESAKRYFGSLIVYEANDYLAAGKFDEAISHYEQAIAQSFEGVRSVKQDCLNKIDEIRAAIRMKEQGKHDEMNRKLEEARKTEMARASRPKPSEQVNRGGTENNNNAGNNTGANNNSGSLHRSDEEELLRKLHLHFIQCCRRENGELLSPPTIRVNGKDRTICGANEQGIEYIITAGAIAKDKWEKLQPETLLGGYFGIVKKTADDHWGIAIFAKRHGHNDRAEEILYELLKKDPTTKPRIDAFLARIKAMDVPNGGFIPWVSSGKKRFITPEEKEAIDAAERVEQLVETIGKNAGQAGASRQQILDQAITEIQKYGPEAKKRAVEVILQKKEQIRKQIAQAGFGSNGELDRMKRELDEARKEALKRIFDKELYPDENHGAVGQPKVDEAVDKVKVLWNNPAGAIERIDPGVSRMVDKANDLIEIAKRVDPTNEVLKGDEEAQFLEYVKAMANKKLDIKNYSNDGGERQRYAQNSQIERDNNLGKSEATQREREHVSIVNAYRNMMGRNALRINSKLTIAARRHSDYMKATSQFAHSIPGHPDGQEPGQRAQKQGYSGGVGENIAMSSRGHTPQSAFDAWYHSSGHHRNMLNDRWRVMGAGDAGTHWTQLFGPSEDGTEPKEGK